jgi:hypothetical protein
VPPLISIRSFSAAASLVGLMGKPLHLKSVELEGLEVYIPPDRNDPDPEHDSGVRDSPRGRLTPPEAKFWNRRPRRDTPLIIDSIMSKNSSLEITSKKPGKLPRMFEIHDLVMTDFAFDRPATFKASLTNPKPEGKIAVTGSFGPWLRDNPRGTPIDGNYVFDSRQPRHHQGHWRHAVVHRSLRRSARAHHGGGHH